MSIGGNIIKTDPINNNVNIDNNNTNNNGININSINIGNDHVHLPSLAASIEGADINENGGALPELSANSNNNKGIQCVTTTAPLPHLFPSVFQTQTPFGVLINGTGCCGCGINDTAYLPPLKRRRDET